MSHHLKQGDLVTVVQRKFDGAVYRRMPKRVVRAFDHALILEGAPGEPIQSENGNWTTTHFDLAHNWLDRWFNVIEFFDKQGAFEFFYVNIQMPAQLKDNELDLIDLDLDLWVKPALTWELLDQDEFDLHRVKYAYPSELIGRIYQTVEEVKTQITRRAYPFRRSVMTFAQARADLLARHDTTD